MAPAAASKGSSFKRGPPGQKNMFALTGPRSIDGRSAQANSATVDNKTQSRQMSGPLGKPALDLAR